MISERLLLSSVVDIINIIFQKEKLNGILVGDREKKFNAYQVKREKIQEKISWGK